MTECSNNIAKPATNSFKFNKDAKPFVFCPTAKSFVPPTYVPPTRPIVSKDNTVNNLNTPKLNAAAKAFNPQAPVFVPVRSTVPFLNSSSSISHITASDALQKASKYEVNHIKEHEVILEPQMDDKIQTVESKFTKVITTSDIKEKTVQVELPIEIETVIESVDNQREPEIIKKENNNQLDHLSENKDKEIILKQDNNNQVNHVPENNIIKETIKKENIGQSVDNNLQNLIKNHQMNNINTSLKNEKEKENEISIENNNIPSPTSCGRYIYAIPFLRSLGSKNIQAPVSILGFDCYIGSNKYDNDNSTTWDRTSRRERHNDRRGGNHSPNHRDNRRRGDNSNSNNDYYRRNNPIDTAPLLEDCKPLEVNEETRWKAHSIMKTNTEMDKMVMLLGKATAILNKLSLEKFERLSDQFIELAMTNIEDIKSFINIIITKAQMEWHFAEMYATLCSKMHHIIDDNNTNRVFRLALLNQCQSEFEQRLSDVAPENSTLEEEEEYRVLVKRKTLGHIKFIGELFRQGLISTNTMHQCINELFGNIEEPDQENLECLCKLLGTVGLKLEDRNRTNMNQYFKTIQILSNNDRLDTRLKFMLKDVMELRKSNWIARRKEAKAATIAEIHAEVKREEREKNRNSSSFSDSFRRPLLRQSNSISTSSLSRVGSGDYRRDHSTTNVHSTTVQSINQADPDGWLTVPGKSKLSKSKSFSERNQWTSSSSSCSFSSSSNINNTKDTLRKVSTTSSSSTNKSSNLLLSKKSSFSQLPSLEKALRKKEKEKKRNEAKKVIEQSSSNSLEEHSSSISTEEQYPSICLKEFKDKSISIISDYISSMELEETKKDLIVLNANDYFSDFICVALDLGLGKKEKERKRISELIVSLAKSCLLTKKHFDKALEDFMSLYDDILMDSPLLPIYFAEMMSSCIEFNYISLDDIILKMKHLNESGATEKLLIALIQSISDSSRLQQIIAETKSLFLLNTKNEILINLLSEFS